MPNDKSAQRCALRRLCGAPAILMLSLVAVSRPVLAAGIEPPTLLLAERYCGDIDVSRHRDSEKLDGVRAVWDGKKRRFRNGNPVAAAKWFLDPLPGQPLDGELWLGRGSFDQLSAIVRSFALGNGLTDAQWRQPLPIGMLVSHRYRELTSNRKRNAMLSEVSEGA